MMDPREDLLGLWKALTPFGRAVFIAVPLVAVCAVVGAVYVFGRGIVAVAADLF